MMKFDRFDDLPPHIVAAMSPAEKNYHRAVLDGSRVGFGYITSHRQLEARMSSAAGQRMIAEYFPDEALATFDRFSKRHWRNEPTRGRGSESTLSERIRIHYPKLFANLRTRLAALFEISYFAAERVRFELLEEAYFNDLACAETIARKLEGSERKLRLHNDYRLAFANIHNELRALLLELVAIGETMQQRGR